LAVINGTDAESDSEYESEYDDSVLDKYYEMPVDQCESQDLPTTSTQASKSPKKTHLDKAASSQKAGKSTQVTTLKLSTTKTGSGRIKKPLDVNAQVIKNMEYFQRTFEAKHNNKWEMSMQQFKSFQTNSIHIKSF
jgi:hypothetical protein